MIIEPNYSKPNSKIDTNNGIYELNRWLKKYNPQSSLESIFTKKREIKIGNDYAAIGARLTDQFMNQNNTDNLRYG